MKIAFIGQKGIPAKQGGIERHVEELSTRLSSAGFDVYAYSRPHYIGNHKKSYNGVKLINMPSFNTKHLDAITHTLVSTIHALFQNYDVIHYHGVGPSLLSWIPRIFKPGTKVIATFHCLDRKHQKWNSVARLMLSIGERSACKFPHQTITVSKTLKKYCDYRFDQETIYIPNGVSIENYRQNKKILTKYGLKKNSYILVASRLVRHKGIHTLIEAYNQLNTNKKLVIAGEGANTYDYVREVRKLADGNKNIIFVGQQVDENLSTLFENAYMFIQPSEAEGLSIALLEAISYNLPIITSDIEENMEIVGKLATKFKNKDVSDLAKKIGYALENEAKIRKNATLAKRHIDKRYNWDNIIEQTVELYQQPFNSLSIFRILKTASK